MAGDPKVVVVSVGEPPTPLIAELSQRGLVVSECSIADAEEEIERVEADLVVLHGSRGAMELATLLDDPERKSRPKLAIVAGGRELSRLWGLNREIVVSLLASEMSVRVIAERLQGLAKQWARAKLDPNARFSRLPSLGETGFTPQPFPAVTGTPQPFPAARGATPQPFPAARGPFDAAKAAAGGSSAKTEAQDAKAAPDEAPSSGTDLASMLSLGPLLDPKAVRSGGATPSEVETQKPPTVEVPAEAKRPSPVAVPKPAATKAERPASMLIDDLESFLASEPPQADENAPAPPAMPPATAPVIESLEPLSIEAESLVGEDLEILADSIAPPAPEAPSAEPPRSPVAAAPVVTVPAAHAPAAHVAAAHAPAAPRRAFAATLLGVPQAPSPALPGAGTPIAAPAAPIAAPAAPAAPETPLDTDGEAGPGLGLGALGAEPSESPLAGHLDAAQLDATSPRATTSTGGVSGALGTGAAPLTEEVAAARPKGPNKALGLVLAAIVGGGALAAIYANQKPKSAPLTAAKSGAAPDSGAAATATSAAPETAPTQPSAGEATEAAASGDAAPTADAPAPSGSAPTTGSVSTSGIDPFVVEDQKLPGCDVLAKGVIPRTPDAPGEASVAWADARKAIMKGDLETANLKMCEAVTLNDQSAAIEGLALLYVTRKSPSQGMAWLTRAEAIRPGQLETQTMMGVAQSQLGHEDEALSTWLTSLHIAPTETDRRQMVAKEDTSVGRRYLKQGDVPRAERLLRRAAILDPTNALALTGMGEVCLKEGRAVAALAFADRAIGIFEANPDAHVLRGDAALLAGDRAMARASYERALAIRPDFWAATLKLRALDTPPN